MSVVPAVAVAVSGNSLIDAHQRLGELHRRAAVVLTQLGEAGLTRPKDALRSVVVDELIYIKGEQLKCCCMVCHLSMTSTGATHVVDRLISCPLCPDSIKSPLISLRSDKKRKCKQKEEEMKLRGGDDEPRDLRAGRPLQGARCSVAAGPRARRAASRRGLAMRQKNSRICVHT